MVTASCRLSLALLHRCPEVCSASHFTLHHCLLIPGLVLDAATNGNLLAALESLKAWAAYEVFSLINSRMDQNLHNLSGKAAIQAKLHLLPGDAQFQLFAGGANKTGYSVYEVLWEENPGVCVSFQSQRRIASHW